MNKYLKEYLHRGLMFGGFGPVILGIIYFVLSKTLNAFSLSGGELLLAIVSTYLLAFVQAGSTVFNQIEHWTLAKSLLCHFASLYSAYVICYVANSWIPFEWGVVAVFTSIFVVAYFVIWTTVYLSVKATSKKLNRIIK